MTKNRITSCFEALGEKRRKALISYLVGGDPSPEYTVDLMHSLVKEGTDIIELGVPFSDPSADGPVIQRAHERALEHKIGLGDIFEMVAEFRVRDAETPIVLMGYANPVEWMGAAKFCEKATSAGVDGVLIVDLPPEESAAYSNLFAQYGLQNVFLLAPTTSHSRIEKICSIASGFLYYVSLKGVTGAGNLDINDVKNHVDRIQKTAEIPVCVGFGIKDADSAQTVSAVADGVVVGSAIVQKVVAASSKQLAMQDIEAFVAELRNAIDQAD